MNGSHQPTPTCRRVWVRLIGPTLLAGWLLTFCGLAHAGTYQLLLGFEGREVEIKLTPGRPAPATSPTLDPLRLKGLAPAPLPSLGQPPAGPTPRGFFGTTSQETSGLNYPNGFEMPAVVLPLRIRDQFDPANNIPGAFGGASSLGMVMEFYGLNLTDNQIADRIGITEVGCSPGDIARAAREFGFQASFDGSPKSIADLRASTADGHPVIVNFTTPEFPGGHFAVVSGFTADNKIILLEPAHGVRTEMDVAQFERNWYSPADRRLAVFVQPAN